MSDGGEVTRIGVFSMQVCVPVGWSDIDVKQFADHVNPCGTEHGWHIRRQGDPALHGDLERNPCNRRARCVHITLDA
jgi:hypothetical protein